MTPRLSICSPRGVVAAIALLALTCGTSSRASSAELWVPFIGNGVEVFTSKQLQKSGAPEPLHLDSLPKATGLAFDKSRNLWAAIIDPDEVVRFTPAQLKHLKDNPDPTPGVIISVASASRGCNFDPQGNLWIADLENNSLEELSKAQLASGTGSPTPAVTITSADLDQPDFVTFDKAGNVWVTDAGLDKIVEFSSGQLSSGGSKSPNVILTDDGSGTSISSPGEIAFDKKGNLWVPNRGADTVVEYAKAQLTSSGNPAPTVKLISAVFDEPWGAAFDNKGDLIVVNSENGIIAKFASKQLKKSGAPIPEVTLTTGENDNFQIIFGPPS